MGYYRDTNEVLSRYHVHYSSQGMHTRLLESMDAIHISQSAHDHAVKAKWPSILLYGSWPSILLWYLALWMIVLLCHPVTLILDEGMR